MQEDINPTSKMQSRRQVILRRELRRTGQLLIDRYVIREEREHETVRRD